MISFYFVDFDLLIDMFEINLLKMFKYLLIDMVKFFCMMNNQFMILIICYILRKVYRDTDSARNQNRKFSHKIFHNFFDNIKINNWYF